jgi:hypothetical protein
MAMVKASAEPVVGIKSRQLGRCVMPGLVLVHERTDPVTRVPDHDATIATTIVTYVLIVAILPMLARVVVVVVLVLVLMSVVVIIYARLYLALGCIQNMPQPLVHVHAVISQSQRGFNCHGSVITTGTTVTIAIAVTCAL